MESLFFGQVLSIMTLLMIASLAALLKKKIPLPYSIILVILGVGVGLLADNIAGFEFIKHFQLTPEMVFYIFLPALIFESAYHLNLWHFRRSFKNIAFLSTITFGISLIVIAYGVHIFFGINPVIALLFGSIISSTDPVATLALFKEIGAPPRLVTIIEGESLLNDGMALVTFGILIELVRNATHLDGINTIISFGSQFLYVVLGGIIVGGILGYIFSVLVSQVKNSREIEITLTIILAHTTFLFAESLIGVSGIIATMIAGMVIGNFGRHKISPSVQEFMSHFWDFAAFISNSLIFLLVGKEIVTRFTTLPNISIKSVIIIVTVALVGRVISVYVSVPFMNLINRNDKISGNWAHIIQWSGIRGALALALLLSLPTWVPDRDLLIFFGLTTVMFTLLVNGNTIQWLIKKLKIQAFSLADNFEKHECKVVIDQNILNKLQSYHDNKFITKETYQELRKYYKKDETKESHFIEKLIKGDQIEGNLYLIIKNHFLGIERQTFQKLYARGEITERLLLILLSNVDEQIENLESKQTIRIAPIYFISSDNQLFNKLRNIKLIDNFLTKRAYQEQTLRYEMYRARIIAINKVLQIINNLKTNSKFVRLEELKKLTINYELWLKKAEKKEQDIKKHNPQIAYNTELYIMQKLCLQKEEIQINKLLSAQILSPKVAQRLLADVQERKISNQQLICMQNLQC